MKKGYPGALIVLEGVDGCGKTTNIKHLEAIVREMGYDVVVTREPGGEATAEKLREIALAAPMDPMAELLTFSAARAQHMAMTIRPALAAGKVVLCDRFALSTYAYQGCGRNLKDEFWALNRLVLGDFEPDFVLYFDVTLEESIARLKLRRKTDHFDEAQLEFKQRVFDGFQEIDDRFERFGSPVKINGMQTPDAVKAEVEEWARNRFFSWMLLHLFAFDGPLPDPRKAVAFAETAAYEEVTREHGRNSRVFMDGMLYRLEREAKQAAEQRNE
ncbi:dTMP kinase [Paraburkholderia sp. BCC1886]|uniref:dTMP kinase n=1 Tax=Paraburkholderia sp. BCC1886 TaxID=2562670 RepID=UPI0016426DDC|nr:dTMP kinase [Paraburkholderia sp. BCC1886]